MKVVILTFFFLSLFVKSSASEIQVTPGKYNDYYHLKFELMSGSYSLNAAYGYNEGGQFEVFVAKNSFPISAPNCEENIIIRMPYSDDTDAKQKLYAKLSASENVSVVLELNPYVTVVKSEPIELQLQYCNVFFRQKSGAYFDQL